MIDPRTKKDLDMLISGEIEETPTLSYRASIDRMQVIQDVAAMGTDGGVIVHGAKTDDWGSPVKLVPFALCGEPERIDMILRTGIRPTPIFSIRTIATSPGVPADGCIVVSVKPSGRPHMVLREHRYYGRDNRRNRLLEEGEIARLYYGSREI